MKESTHIGKENVHILCVKNTVHHNLTRKHITIENHFNCFWTKPVPSCGQGGYYGWQVEHLSLAVDSEPIGEEVVWPTTATATTQDET